MRGRVRRVDKRRNDKWSRHRLKISKYSSPLLLLHMLAVACVAHLNPVFSGVVHSLHEYIRFCRAPICARKMCEFFIHVTKSFTFSANFWMRASNYLPTATAETCFCSSKIDFHTITKWFNSKFIMELSTFISAFICIVSTFLLYFSLNRFKMDSQTNAADTPRVTRREVPSKPASKSSSKQTKATFQFNGPVTGEFKKQFYPEQDDITSVHIGTASMKYKALSFGLENLDEIPRLAEMKRFALFYNKLSDSLTELFDAQTRKLKHDMNGLNQFTSLQNQFIAAGDNLEIHMELVKLAYKKAGSPTRERVVRGIQRSIVTRDHAEYRLVTKFDVYWDVLKHFMVFFRFFSVFFRFFFGFQESENPKNLRFSKIFTLFSKNLEFSIFFQNFFLLKFRPNVIFLTFFQVFVGFLIFFKNFFSLKSRQKLVFSTFFGFFRIL